jgi:DNA-directed RNA polymerase subunit RPC12/RpoP
MTVETRTTIALSDIKGYEFECSECHSKTVRPLSAPIDMPIQCPACRGKQWMIPGSPAFSALRQFLGFLQQPAVNGSEGFSFRLEIAGLSERK